jgi:PAS domain S-box-containing protein
MMTDSRNTIDPIPPRMLKWVVLLLTLAAFGYALRSVWLDYRFSVDQRLHNQAIHADMAKERTEDYLAVWENVFNAVQESACLRQRDRTACSDLFSRLNQRFPEVINFTAHDRNGNTIASGRPVHRQSDQVWDAALFEEIAKGRKRRFVDPHSDPVSGDEVTGIVLPMTDEQNRFDGLIGASFRFSRFETIWQEIFRDTGSLLLILDSHGRTIHAPPWYVRWRVKNAADLGIPLAGLVAGQEIRFSVDGQEFLGQAQWIGNNEWALITFDLADRGFLNYLLTNGKPWGLLLPVLAFAFISVFMVRRDDRLMASLIATQQALIEHQETLEKKVTERTEALQKSEARFRCYYELGLIGMAVVSNDRRWLHCNDHLCEMLGYSRSELLYRSSASLTHPEDEKNDAEHFARLLGGEIGSFRLTKRLLRRDGSWMHATISLGCSRKENGEIDQIVEMIGDVSDRVALEQELHGRIDVLDALTTLATGLLKEKPKLHDIALQVLDFARKLTVSEHGFVSEIDPETRKNVAYAITPMMDAAGELIGSKPAIVFSAPKNGVYPGLWGRALNTRNGFFTNHPPSDPSSAGVPEGHVGIENFLTVPVIFQEQLYGQIAIANSSRPYDDKDLDAVALLADLFALAIDIDRREKERRRHESMLIQAQKMESIGMLAGGIAHDFNNILAAMLGYASLSKDIILSGKIGKAGDYLDHVIKGGNRAREVVGQLLAFSRNQDLETAELKLAKVVEDTRGLLKGAMPASVHIESTCNGGCPPVVANAANLHQVLMNVCINARDAMNDRGDILIECGGLELDEVRVCHSCHQPFFGKFAYIAVTDNGPGIRPEDMERIFDPFFTSKPIGKGTGMGLSVVHGIMHMHGGHVCVHPATPQGTRFELYLPVARLHAENLPEVTDLVTDVAKHRRVLVVDDEPVVRAFMEDALRLYGHAVTAVDSAEAALAALAANPGAFDVVLTDQTMPEMSGAELAERLRALAPELPVILVSGLMLENDPLFKVPENVCRILSKPITPLQLMQALADPAIAA